MELNRKSIFRIARRGSADDEDQLTELVAYLIQEEPVIALLLLSDFGYEAEAASVTTQQKVVGGRLDLEFESPQACVVVESKLGATTDFAQCAKYIEYLAAKPVPLRSLVLLTKLHEPWPLGIEPLAAKAGVQLVARRWWDITSLLRRARTRLGTEFAEMLEGEGLVVPGPLTEQDWTASTGIPPTAVALLTELKPKLMALSHGFHRHLIAQGRSSQYRSIYCLSYFDYAQVGLGFAASWEDLRLHRRLNSDCVPLHGSVVACSVLDPSLREAERRERAEVVVKQCTNEVVGSCWGTFPTRASSAASVLTASDFQGQAEQALEYARETVEHFRGVGYLNDM